MSHIDTAAPVVTPVGYTTYKYVGLQGIAFETKTGERATLTTNGIVHIKPSSKAGVLLVKLNGVELPFSANERVAARLIKGSKLYKPSVANAEGKASPHLVAVRPLIKEGKALAADSKTRKLIPLVRWFNLHVGVKTTPERLAMAMAYYTDKNSVLNDDVMQSKKYLSTIGFGMYAIRLVFGKNGKMTVPLGSDLLKALSKTTALPADLALLMREHDKRWKFDGSVYRKLR